MEHVLTPDLAAASRYLDMLELNGSFTFQTFDDKKTTRVPKRKFDLLAQVFHGTLLEHANTLTRLQQQGAGVFVMVNRGDGIVHPNRQTCRCTESVIAIRSLFVDLDGSPLQPVLDALRPDFIVESSPGRWHGYWLTNDCPLGEFSLLQKQIAQKFAGDPTVHDLPRVMRLPGFWHQKATPFMTKVIYPE